jgi:hypothetical protein
MDEAGQPSGRELVGLKDQVVKVFNESNWRELGALTETLDQVEGHPHLLRSLSWNDPDYEGIVLQMLRRMISAHPGNYDVVLTYINRTCPEHGEFISSSDEGARRIVFSPMVFKVPGERPNINLVSVMMPFDAAFGAVYETIKAATTATGFECRRVDDMWDDSTVVQDVFSLIFQSYVVVCDFTGKNPNVFYEAGIAHTLGKHVIPITQNEDHIPFDLRHHRYAYYLNNVEGRESLQQELENRLTVLAKKKPLANWR